MTEAVVSRPFALEWIWGGLILLAYSATRTAFTWDVFLSWLIYGPVGALLLLAAAVLFAVGRLAVVGPSRLGRTALIVLGAAAMSMQLLPYLVATSREPWFVYAVSAVTVVVGITVVLSALMIVRAGVLARPWNVIAAACVLVWVAPGAVQIVIGLSTGEASDVVRSLADLVGILIPAVLAAMAIVLALLRRARVPTDA